MNLHHHTRTSLFTLHALLLGALLLALTTPRTAQAQQDPAALLAMAESAQANDQHQVATEILVSLRGQLPAAQLAGMLSASELAMGDYRMAELTAISALREPGDAWVSTHRDTLMNTLAEAGRHLGEVLIEGLPAGLPVSTRDLNLGVTGQRLRLAEGPRVLTVALPDGRRLLVTTQVVPGQTTRADGSNASVIGGPAPAAPGSSVAALPNVPGYAAAPSAPRSATLPAGAHAAPTASQASLFQARRQVPAATPARSPNRYGLAIDVGEDLGVEYASQQSQAIDGYGDTMNDLDNAAIVGGGHLFFQHDLGAHFTLASRLAFGFHKRRAASAWNIFGDPDYDLHLREMNGHVSRFSLAQTARVVYGRRNAWLTSYIGIGGRVGLAVFRYSGHNYWRNRRTGGLYVNNGSGAELGYMAQGVLELGSYFGRKRTVEFGGTVSAGKPLLSVAFHLGVSFNGW